MDAAKLQAPEDKEKQDMFEQSASADPIAMEQPPGVNEPQQEQDPPAVEPPTPAKMESAEQATRPEARQNQAERGNLLTAAATEEELQKVQLQTMKESAVATLEKGKILIQTTTGAMIIMMVEDSAERGYLWLEVSQEQQPPAAPVEQSQLHLQDDFDGTTKPLRIGRIHMFGGKPVSDSEWNGLFG